MANSATRQDLTDMEHYDVIVVGAGIWGLAAAHTFLKIDPAISILIIDSKQSIGGVWAEEQLYPGLQTNNLQGYYEFSDFPMLEAGVGVKPRGPMTGEAVHHYIAKFADHFDLTRRIRLGTQVVRAVEDNSKGPYARWILELGSVQGAGVVRSISCEKLVVATGQANKPFRPSLRGSTAFERPIVHTVDLGRKTNALIEDEAVKNITVLGGSKSAHDAVYLFATAGKNVKWIIHSTDKGRGAVPMVVSYMKLGGWNCWLEPLFMLRPLSWFGPAPWADGDGFTWIRWFLHSTRLGNRLVKWLFDDLGLRAALASGIIKDESTKDLIPGASMMWYGTQSNVLAYDTDFYDLIRSGKVSLTLGHVDHLNEGRVCLEDGMVIGTDALILATGYDWSASVTLEPADKRASWGCPVNPSDDTIYPALDAVSDKEIFSRYRLLRESPAKPERLPALTGWRLWRFLAPPSQVANGKSRNLVFLNTIASYQSFMRSEITSLWAYAYLYDRLAVRTPTEAEARKEVSLWTRFEKWRTPFGLQGKLTDFLLDSMPYHDLLLRDLGLRSWRKGWGWFGEVFGGAYENSDYRNIVREWIATQSDLVIENKKQR